MSKFTPFLVAGYRRRRGSRGAALIIVLSFVILLAVVVAAFLVHSQLILQIMNARTAGTQVDVVARSAIEFTKADLRQEIVAGSTVYTTGGTTVYVPTTNLTVAPSRTGFTPGTAGSDPMDNIVKISKSGASFFSGPSTAYNTAYPSPSFASAISTSTPSLNGRYIDSSTGWSTSGWDMPQLIDTVKYPAGLTAPPLPDWIYITTSGRQVLTAPTANVVGRYAFVIYDEGGLLDVNVAGYPSTLSSADARDPYRKGPLALADLTKIPGGLTSSMQDSLITWRNAATSATGAFASTNYPTATAPDYLKYVLNGSLNKGFKPIYPGDQKFLSRQDLLAYSLANPTLLPAQSLAYLSTFTRTLNAPTWTPVTPPGASFIIPATGSPSTFTYESKAENAVSPWTYNVDSVNTRWTAAVTITRPKLDADIDCSPSSTVTTVPTEIITFQKGDPVLQHRFPLSKIALLSNPAAQLSSQVATVGSVAWAVNYYFGLQWVASDTTLNEPHWEYVHALPGTQVNTSLSNANNIRSIPDVAALKTREPDFFEILRQGVLRGSAEDIIILEMGASIIDQFGGGDLPTAITNGTGSPYREVFGKKNIPYFSQMLFWPYRPKADITRATFEAYLVPMFWNPHRNASTVSGTINNFQIILDPGTTPANYPAANFPAISPSPVTSGMTSAGTIPFSTSASSTYQEPIIVTGGICSPSGGLGITESTDGRSGFFLGSVVAPDMQATINAGGSGAKDPNLLKSRVVGLGTGTPLTGNGTSPALNCTVQCQYNGAWHTYENFSLSDGTQGSTYWETTDSNGANGVSAAPSFSSGLAPSYVGLTSSGPVDPRVSSGATIGGSRVIAGNEVFTAGVGTLPKGLTWQSAAPEAAASPGCTIQCSSPVVDFGYFPESPASIRQTLKLGELPGYLGMWNQNNSTTAYAYYLDYCIIATNIGGDLVQRPGDDVYGANPMASDPVATDPKGTSYASDRPLILNRPFRSVGELGYSYRGIEWKTVDFSSALSGDSGLLDMFSIGESQKVTQSGPAATPIYSSVPLSAGVVNINTRHPEVLQALLSGSIENDLDSNAGTLISSTQASGIANAIVAETSAGGGPLVNRSDIVNRLMNLPNVLTQLASTSVGTDSKPDREAVVRALAEPADTRTWNLLIDLDVQLGRYPPNAVSAGTAAALAQFNVQGERRYWLHLALDRYTGKVIDDQLEVVNAN
jgi:hypothetical protein